MPANSWLLSPSRARNARRGRVSHKADKFARLRLVEFIDLKMSPERRMAWRCHRKKPSAGHNRIKRVVRWASQSLRKSNWPFLKAAAAARKIRVFIIGSYVGQVTPARWHFCPSCRSQAQRLLSAHSRHRDCADTCPRFGTDGIVRARFVDPDYRVRMATEDMLAALRSAT
jgi:hypothetical protein